MTRNVEGRGILHFYLWIMYHFQSTFPIQCNMEHLWSKVWMLKYLGGFKAKRGCMGIYFYYFRDLINIAIFFQTQDRQTDCHQL